MSILFRGRWPGALVILFFVFAAAQEIHLHGQWRSNTVLSWDIGSYYHYLPAAFIHTDLRDLSYVAHTDSILHPDGSQSRFGINVDPTTGHDVIKFPCGTALFELPLFLVTHAYVALSGTYPADGYSLPYQLSVCASTVLFVSFGLWLLAAFLRRYVEEGYVVVALVVIAFGTNLFYYSTLAAGMSHGYLFFLFAAVLYLTDRWQRDPRATTVALLGLAIGLSVVVRPVDGLIFLVPLLWRSPVNGEWSAIRLLRTHPRQTFLLGTCIIAACLPQLLYWKWTTGSFVHYSYPGEGFDFTQPHVVEGLMGYRKGWLIYSPLVILGLIGLASMFGDRSMRYLAIPVVSFLAVFTYIVFSWTQWWYGGSFGSRPMVSALALLALPVAYLARQLFSRHRVLGLLLVVVIAGGIKLNMFQQNQYRRGIIHWDSMTGEQYWEVFGLTDTSGAHLAE